MAVGVSASTMGDTVRGLGATMGLLVSSIITLIAISAEGVKSNNGEEIYGLVVSILTILVVAASMKLEGFGLKFPVMVFFCIMWVVSACLLTFRRPFVTTGNGKVIL